MATYKKPFEVEEKDLARLRPSGTNTNDRLPGPSFRVVESSYSLVQGDDSGDIRFQSSIPHALYDLGQLEAVGFNDEVDCETVGGSRFGSADDGH
jgi:hypothetical protein